MANIKQLLIQGLALVVMITIITMVMQVITGLGLVLDFGTFWSYLLSGDMYQIAVAVISLPLVGWVAYNLAPKLSAWILSKV